MFSDIEQILTERGWAVIELPDPSPVLKTREWLLGELRMQFLNLTQIEDYHSVAPDENHFAVVHELAQKFWDAQHGRQIIAANLSFFRNLLGADLHVQKYPYLRVIRPGQSGDAVPLHRDTYYGASPFELSVVVPFTDMGNDSALRAVAGSHIEPDSAYPFVQTESANVTPGSPRHTLGYAYAPRLLDSSLDARIELMPVRVGQALIFGLSLVHGGGANSSNTTRFSMDVRIVNSFAPVSFSRGVHPDYFVPLCASPVSLSARRYIFENETAEAARSGLSQ